MAFEALTGDLLTKSWTASTRAYQTEHYLIEEVDITVYIAFRPSFSANGWFAPANKSPFGEIKMKRDRFPCMRSIGNDVDATVNEAFLNNLEAIINNPRTSFNASVKMAVDSKKQIVFTGHSSGGAAAILATVWYLETYLKWNPSGLPEPRCVTFGAPLVGDYVFKHALGRENWSRFFTNFVTRFDIVPRMMLAQKASTEQTLPHVLRQLDPTTRAPIQENDQRITEFYTRVMRDTSTVAYKAVCELIGNGEAFLETLSSFLELSPYRPLGTFVFSTGKRLVAVNNSEAILQMLFYTCQSSDEQEWSLIPYRSIIDHHIHSYEQVIQSMVMGTLLYHLDLNHLPLDGETSALNELGLSTRGRQCVRAAFEAEKQREDNQNKIANKRGKIEEKLIWIVEEYKPKCQAHKNGYYDSFKASSEENDFKANVKRAELAGIYDEVLGLLKKGLLPDGFEGSIWWVKLATDYRRLIEPLDIANYHRHLKNEDTGPYMGKGRPNRYKYAQRWYEHELFKAGRMIAFWSKVNALNLGSQKEMQHKLQEAGSTCGSCFWAEVEELNGKPYQVVELRVKTLEGLLQGWIEEGEVDDREIFLESSTFRKWWDSLPDNHKFHSQVKKLIMGDTRAT